MWQTVEVISTLVIPFIRVSFRGGGGEHSPLLGFGLPPLGNFDLKVNQFKCSEIFNSCAMHNKCQQKFKVLYVRIYILAIQQSF